jgi:hypothetical protein
MSNIMRDIYVTHGDKTIKFGTYLFKSESYDENVNKLLLSNQLSVEGFLKYIENEETQKIIKTKVDQTGNSALYDKLKDEIKTKVINYFHKYRNRIFKESYRYQKVRFEKNFPFEKYTYYIDYCRYYTERSLPENFKILIPANSFYYLKVTDGIVNKVIRKYSSDRNNYREYTPLSDNLEYFKVTY